jgi:hypothetical protein
VQAANAPPSRRHSKLPSSLDVNVNVASCVDTVPAGPPTIVVNGGSTSAAWPLQWSVKLPAAPFLPSTAIRYVVPATALNVARLAGQVADMLSLLATAVSAPTDEPV